MRLELFRSPTSSRSRGSRDLGTAIARINHRILHPVNPEILEILIQTINHRQISNRVLVRLELFQIPDFSKKSGIYFIFILDYRAEKNGVQ